MASWEFIDYNVQTITRRIYYTFNIYINLVEKHE